MRLRLIPCPDYPKTVYFRLANATPLLMSASVSVAHHTSFEAPIQDLQLPFLEQVSAMIVHCRIRMSKPIVAGLHWASIAYPNLATTATEPLTCLFLPGNDLMLSQIVAQSKHAADGPELLYSAVSSMASQVAYEADSAVDISEWQWFSIRGDRVLIRRDFRPSGDTDRVLSWDHMQMRLQAQAHLRGDTLWLRAFAYHREGLGPGMPMYQFLALYKGCEVLRKLESRVGERGFVFSKREVVWPSVLLANFPNLEGLSVHKVLEHELRKPFRHAVAHWEVEDRDGNLAFAHSDIFQAGIVQYAGLVEIAKVCFRELAESLMRAAPPSALGG